MKSKQRIGWLVVVLVCVLGAAWHLSSAQEAKPNSLQKWEYKFSPTDNYGSQLAELGDQGWELVSVVSDGHGFVGCLKRPK